MVSSSAVPLRNLCPRDIARRFRGVLLGILWGALAFVPLSPAAPDAINDNSRPPFLAVYRWGQSGVINGHYDAYGPWLNRSVIWGEDFMPNQGWNKIEGEEWQLGTWKGWCQKQPGRRLVLSVPLLPGGWAGKGPATGPGASQPVSLAVGAKGAYNVYFQRLAENLVAHQLGDTLLRLGWEFNGGWYTWRAQTKEKAVDYAGYFHQIVTAMRAVPGAEGLKFVWNPAMEPWWPYSPELAWPGDDVVDYVGVDVYDQSWAKETYPWPKDATEAEIEIRQSRAWDQLQNNAKTYGLPYWVEFAQKHHKPLTIPEWGVCDRSDKHGGMDNPLFIERMHRFITDPANNVYFACYFDVGAPDGDHQLCPDGKRETRFPKASRRYKELFSLPSQ